MTDEEKKPDVAYCEGCMKDFANDDKGNRCWMLEFATVIDRWEIGIDDAITEAENWTPVRKPDCYVTGGKSGSGTMIFNELPAGVQSKAQVLAQQQEETQAQEKKRPA